MLGLSLAGVLAYANSISGAFVFDDNGAIVDNPTIRQLWPLHEALSPPHAGLPVTGRPVTNLSFAINYAIHGLDVRGFHAVNIAIHVAVGLLLFAVARRTLDRLRVAGRSTLDPGLLGGVIALLWLVHPLQTGGVSYISQRAESLASLCIIGSLYAFIRSLDTPRPGRWLAVSVIAAWVGVGSKEIVAVIPILVVAYHRLFVSSSWVEALRCRPAYLITLTAAWAPLAWLALGTENRGGTWGAEAGFTPLEYLRIQCDAIVHYLRLVVWPAPLVFDYGRDLHAPSWIQILPQGLLLAALFSVTVFALWRGWSVGFLGVWFFGLLAPTSSFVPLADAVFEHRMYLASAAAIAAIAAIVLAIASRWPRLLPWLTLPVAFGLGCVTVVRNADFATAIKLWEDTIAKRPNNTRALGNLGSELIRVGRTNEALPYLERAFRLAPATPLHPHNLANALDALGRREEAIRYYREALEIQPRNHFARTNLAGALMAEGDLDGAIREYETVLQAQPGFADAHRGYARALLRSGRRQEAVTHFKRVVKLRPDDAASYFNLGDALARVGQMTDARDAFQAAVRLDPRHADAWSNLGNVLLLEKDIDRAVRAFEQSLSLRPEARTYSNLGYARLMQRRLPEAEAAFLAALKEDAAYSPARLGLNRARSGRAEP